MTKQIGVYWDISQHKTFDKLDRFKVLLKETNISEVIVMINGMNSPEKFSWDNEKLGEFAEELKKQNIRTSVVLWVEPTLENMNLILDKVLQLIETSKELFTFEFDMEHNWSKEKLDNNFKTLNEAANYFADNMPMREYAEFGVTVHYGRRNLNIATKFDYVNMQSYSITRKFGHKEYDISMKKSGLRYPGNFQNTCYRTISKECPNQDIYLILAAWSQSGYEGLSPIGAMKLQYDEAAKHVDKINYWSAKLIYGKHAEKVNRYAFRFLQKLKKEE